MGEIDDEEYLSLDVAVGMDHMLTDVTGGDPDVLRGTLRQLFQQDPQLVSAFVAEILKGRKKAEEEAAEEAERRWRSYIH